MADTTPRPAAVYRLLPADGDFRTLLLDMAPHLKLARWERSGSPADRPASIGAQWIGDPAWRATEFPSGDTGAPILSRRIADLMGGELSAAGSFLPVTIDGADTGEYVMYLVERVVDCVDPRRSAKPNKGGDPLRKTVFRPEALPRELPAFRVPESPGAVYWNDWAADRLRELVDGDLAARLVWSQDPQATAHPDPWGV